MATVKVKFRKSSVEGKAGTIYYQLCHKQSNRQITTRMRVLPHWWDAEKETSAQPQGRACFSCSRRRCECRARRG